MKHRFCTIFFFLVLLALTTTILAQDKTEPSLYKRIGGYDAIAAVVDDFVPRLVTDPLLGKFFAGHGNDSKKRLRQNVVNMICEALGGPCFYTGRPMKEAHGGLGISEEQWSVSQKHFVATLDKFQVPKKEQDELIAVIVSLKNDIVTPASPAGEIKK